MWNPRRKIARLIVKGEGNRLRLVFSRLIEGYSVNSQPGSSKGSQAFFIFVESPGWVDGILANPRAPVIGHPHETFLCSSLDFLRIDTDQGYPAIRPGHVAGLRRLRSQWIKEILWFECHVIFLLFFFFFWWNLFWLIKIIKQISNQFLLWFVQELWCFEFEIYFGIVIDDWKWSFWNYLGYEKYFKVKKDEQSLR